MPEEPNLRPTSFKAAATCEQLCKALAELRADLKPAPTVPPDALTLRVRQLIGATRKLLGRDALARPLSAIVLRPPVRRAELVAALIRVETALAGFRAPRFGLHEFLNLPAWCLHDDGDGDLARKLIEAPPGSKQQQALAAADAALIDIRAKLADRIDRHTGGDPEKLAAVREKLAEIAAAEKAQRTYPRRRKGA